ncbi:MAG: APC family permease [Solirubrobacterales bacterium]
MVKELKKIIFGKPLATEEMSHEKLNIPFGLAILSSDAISSVAYASEEILWVLIPVIGIMSYKYMFDASLAIIALLVILVFSYRQTIGSYPGGGGAYTVAKENLGVIPGLVAGASLSVDYLLTVAVSTCAGTAAITSAFPVLYTHRISIALFFIVLITIGNLRGVSESAKIFGIPPYLFIAGMIAMIIYGIYKVKVLGYVPQPGHALPTVMGDVTIFLILRAFSAGCAALTGVEAVSNGVPNFKAPSQKNAIIVLFSLAVTIIFVFGGTSYLATLYHTVPSLEKTVVSQIAIQVFGNGFMYYFIQFTTAMILILAANTAYSGFPLLASAIAKDGYLPRQLQKRGHRLSFNNGIVSLAVLAGILIIVFRGETHYLIPLYAVGVFISFTLSQFGMFTKWRREKGSGWALKAAINGTGAIITLITAAIIGLTKFTEGAWVVFILIPTFVYFMLNVKNSYEHAAEQLRIGPGSVPDVIPNPENAKHIIILVESYNKAIIKTINYAKCLSTDIVGFHVSVNDEATEKLVKRWEEYDVGIPLVIKKSPYRDIMSLLVEFIESDEHASTTGDLVTVVMSQFVVGKWWEKALHNQTAHFIRSTLLKHRNIAVISVPYIIETDMRIYDELIKNHRGKIQKAKKLN